MELSALKEAVIDATTKKAVPVSDNASGDKKDDKPSGQADAGAGNKPSGQKDEALGRDLSSETKAATKEPAQTPDDLRRRAELAVENLVSKLGLSAEVAAHAANAAGNLVAAMNSTANLENVVMNETSKVAGISRGDLGELARQTPGKGVANNGTTLAV